MSTLAPTDTTNNHDPHWHLIAMSPELGELAVSVGKSLSIGRSDSNDIVLASPQISRQHAKINRIGERIYVQDLGSANGTFVNGERIGTQAVNLDNLDELAFADLLFIVNQDAAIDTSTEQAIEELMTADVTDAATDDSLKRATPSHTEVYRIDETNTAQENILQNATDIDTSDSQAKTDVSNSTASEPVIQPEPEASPQEITTTQSKLDVTAEPNLIANTEPKVAVTKPTSQAIPTPQTQQLTVDKKPNRLMIGVVILIILAIIIALAIL